MQIINFKTKEIEEQFYGPMIDNSLLALVYMMAAQAWAWWRHGLTITEVWRENDPAGTHKAWRAVDVRNSDFAYDQAMELATMINDFAEYDPERPGLHCCLVYDLDSSGGHNNHFHIQVHPNTKFEGVENV